MILRTCVLQNRRPNPPTTRTRLASAFFNLEKPSLSFAPRFSDSTFCHASLRLSGRRRGFLPARIGGVGVESLEDDRRNFGGDETVVAAAVADGEEEAMVEVKSEEMENQGMWNQMKEIAMFTGPATGLWFTPSYTPYQMKKWHLL